MAVENTDKGGENNNNNEGQVSKEDFDAVSAENEKYKKDLEEVRMEVFSPEYVDWLANKDKPVKPEEKKEEVVGDDVWEKMSKKEVYDKAKKDATEAFDTRFTEFTTKQETAKNDATKVEITRFAETHEDFEQYRHTMYGLSTDPKNANLGLEQLYTKAKEHVQSIHTKASDVEKEKQQKLKSERPGSYSESFEESDKNLSAKDAASSALSEVKEQLGSIPLE